MIPAPAARAMTAAATSLLAFGLCLYMFLPPMVDSTTASMPLATFFGIGIACAVLAHLAFIGIAARRLGRRATPWVLIDLIGFPVSAIVGMIVLAFFEHEQERPVAGTP